MKALMSIAEALVVVALAGTISQAQMEVTHDLHHAVSPAVRDLPTANRLAQPTIPHKETEPVVPMSLPPGLKFPGEPDPVLQSTAPTAPLRSAPVIGVPFDGLGQGVFGFTVPFDPPDPNGAAGLSQYVQWVNASFAVFEKATGMLRKGPVAGSQLWVGFGGDCEGVNAAIDKDGSDGLVAYDRQAHRWVLSRLSAPSAANLVLECIAVSTTPDATGEYHLYAFHYDNYSDYPKMGVWSDAYYVTYNMIDTNGHVLGAKACALDRTAMLDGQPAMQVCFQLPPNMGKLLPSDLDGTLSPPAGSPNYMLSYGTNSLNLFKFHVDFPTPANSTFTGPIILPVAPFTPLCNGGTCVPQAGTATQLASLADGLMYRLAYRNFGDHEALIVNHSVAVPPGGSIRWYEIQNPNGTPTVVQQSTFAPDSNVRWMGSMAMDAVGDIAVGYSVSGPAMFPSIAMTGRTPPILSICWKPRRALSAGQVHRAVIPGGVTIRPCRWIRSMIARFGTPTRANSAEGHRPSTGPEKRRALRAGQRRAGAVARRWRPRARSLRDRTRLSSGASEPA